jgi:hypothetical protein
MCRQANRRGDATGQAGRIAARAIAKLSPFRNGEHRTD